MTFLRLTAWPNGQEVSYEGSPAFIGEVGFKLESQFGFIPMVIEEDEVDFTKADLLDFLADREEDLMRELMLEPA
jgi:hypothetical protein